MLRAKYKVHYNLFKLNFGNVRTFSFFVKVIKLRDCEEVTKFGAISRFSLNYLAMSKHGGRFFSNFCGLLNISELYIFFRR